MLHKKLFVPSLAAIFASDAFVPSRSHRMTSVNNACLSLPSMIVVDENNPHYRLSQFDPLKIRGGGVICDSCTKLSLLINPSVASLLSGSIAGAIGVGVAFPLDTLKTKSQVLGQTTGKIDGIGSGGGAAAALSGEEVLEMNMFQLIALIYKMEGIQGFYGGVKGMMDSYNLPGVAALLIAACFSGFVTSFLVTPIERIKVLLQSSNAYKNEIDCFQKVIKVEGVIGIFTRGLGPTLAREIPSYGIYFLIYGLLMQLPLATQLGTLAPLIFGAVTGCASWIPVYPIDVVKTLVQASDGSQNVSALEITKQLYNDRGIRGFFDGLTPKMLRAAVNHSVTFYIYDMIYHTLIV
eukprot:scaffold3990_cov284-Chaetoceros_neogracile.AAC.2